MNKSDLDIVFLGLAQNCQKFINRFFKVVYKISKKKNIKVIIGENNSDDFTFNEIHKNVLNKLGMLEFVDTTFIEKFDDRIHRLAAARQQLKKQLLASELKPKYVCVVDLDDVLNDNFNEQLIFNLIDKLNSSNDKHFAVSVKSQPYYYDILNFESSEFPNDQIKQLQSNKTLKSYRLRKKKIYDVQKIITEYKSFECISAFNGLCLYNFIDFIKADYLEFSKDVTPEHLYLNREIFNNTKKKILVCDYYLQMPLEHKPLDNILLFIFEKLKKYISIFFDRVFAN